MCVTFEGCVFKSSSVSKVDTRKVVKAMKGCSLKTYKLQKVEIVKVSFLYTVKVVENSVGCECGESKRDSVFKCSTVEVCA